MAGQQLTTTIVINAKTGSGFGRVGATLTELGTLVNGLSQELISFGKESTEVYRDYEKSMQDARVALSTTYGRGTKELNDVMEQLDAAATEWAASTIFHTDDVSHAISEAAHAGWDYEQIMMGLPAAMQLAQAGSIDLSEAVNYIVKASNAAGIEMEDMSTFIDLWTFAANSSASTVEEFGDAMLRMGSTMRFASDPAELMTLIAVTANAGSVGTEAGTMIRNSMMRLVAPTQKAEKAMALLGATSSETAELMNDEALAAANATLAAHGFSVYDEQGNLRSILDIYRDLYMALGDIAGGYENIGRNQDALQILSAIFPTRTITEALNLLNAASTNYEGLYEAMQSGAAEGYGAYAASTMMDTLNGDIEIFNSKVERLKQVVGGELKGQISDFVGFAGELVDSLAEMDPAAMDALIKGAEVLAAAGPALLITGGAFRLIGAMMTPAGGIAMGVMALAAGAAILNDLEDSKFAENFGNMALDTGEILDYVNGIGEGLRGAYREFDEFKRAVEEAAKAYEKASSSLSSELLTDMLTNKQLTDEDKEALYRLADDMYSALTEGIQNRSSASLSYWSTLFGDEEDIENDPAFQKIMEITSQSMEDATSQAEALSKELRDALTSAFSDGEISDEEYQNIMGVMRSYNDAVAQAAAEAQSEEDFIKMSMWQHKAQTASWDEVNELAQSAAAERDSILSEQEEAYLTERFRLEYRGADQGLLSELDDKYSRQRMQTEAAYDDFLYTLWDSQIAQSEQGANYEWLAGIADQYLSGQMHGDYALQLIEDYLGKSAYAGDNNTPWNRSTDHAELGRMLGTWVASLGGEKELEKRIAYYRETGNEAMAERFAQMYAMEQLANGFNTVLSTERPEWDILGMLQDFTTTGQNEHIMRGNNRASFESALGIEWNPYHTNSGEFGENTGVHVYTPEEAQAAFAAFEELAPEVNVQGNFDALDTGIAERDGQSVTVYVNEQPGGSTYHAGGGSAGRGGSLGGFSGTSGKFAMGGRATEASIFGEGDVPEWAIPEEHTQRTAALLNAARAASGFTWPDLLGMFGGLNANANNSPTTFVYSPVIHANDASGVESVLRDDKARMERWFEERRLREGMEVYA